MNGAEIIMRTAKQAGIEVCFTNFGTTELPLALAFDSEPGIKPVLGLFEGVCTGAADGYGRMADKPAMTLVHLGPGFANGIANLHNARKAKTPLVNLIGEHATQHFAVDAPLTMNIEGLAGTVSAWYKTNKSQEELSQDLSDAFASAMYGQISTLIIPNDFQQTDVKNDKIAVPRFTFDPIDTNGIKEAAQLIKTYQKVGLILGGRALRRRGLEAAARIKATTGCDVLANYSPSFVDRGAGLVAVFIMPYFPEPTLKLLSGYDAIVLIGSREPVSFFAYKGIPSKLLSPEVPRVSIGLGKQSPIESLEALAEALNSSKKAVKESVLVEMHRPSVAHGELTAEKACQTLAALQPESAIIVNEGITSSFSYNSASKGLPPHTMLNLVGGSIGFGLPCSVGAAVACPDRPVIDLQADGSAMYTVQALWTQARQKLNVTTLICSNKSYKILKLEVARANIKTIGPNLKAIVDLEKPDIGWTKMATAMGVPGVSVTTCEALEKEIKVALSESGPHLIEMVLE